MKHIIVTGAKGGTGRSIFNCMRTAGYTVTGIDLENPTHTDEGYKKADVLDGTSLNDLFASADAVVHFGSLPTDHWSSWSTCFENVMMGGFNVLQAAANTGITRIAYASSIEVYGNLKQQPHMPVTEKSPAIPVSIYGSAKLRLEELASDYCRWHDMSIAGFRLGRIVYENSYNWRLKSHTESPNRCVDCLWCYVDARDVATACQLWLESDVTGFKAYNLAADEVCLEVPTETMLQEFYPNIPLQSKIGKFQSPFFSTALKMDLGWQAKHHWHDLKIEAETKL